MQNFARGLETAISTPAGQAHFNNTMNRTLIDLDRSLDNVVDIRTRVGSRLNAIDSQKDFNDSFKLQLQETLSNLQDLDYAEAVSRLNLQITGLQAAQQSFVKIQGLSLFNFLR